jgi:hypothetical protein
MRDVRELMIHGVLLVVAAILAFSVWTGDEEGARADDGLLVEVWPGKADDLQRIEWNGKAKLHLVAQRDAAGAFYVVTVVKQQVTLEPDQGEEKASKAPPKPEEKTIRFLSVAAARPLVEAVAPLKAIRALGNYDESRKSEFGFEEPEGTLRVVFSNHEHSLIVGGSTPGGGDRYARDADSGTLYAVSGDIVRNLTHAEQRLFERDLHEFEFKDIDTLTVDHAGNTRTLTRRAEDEAAWADAETPTTEDETASNWIDKLNRLRPSEYTDQPPQGLGPQSVVVKVEYQQGRRRRGFLELSKVAGDKGADYYVRTEQTRKWYAKVLRSTAEQIEQDVTSVVRQ